MPVIPIADQSQVQNAGNPVPIHSPGSAGMEGQATSEFGAALAKYGDVLDKLNARTAAESSKLQLSDLNAQYTAMVTQRVNEQKAAAAIPGDKTGSMAANAYMTAASKDRDDMLQNMDPSLQMGFKAQADRQISDNLPSVYSAESVKLKADLKPQLGSTVNSWASVARTDPSKAQAALAQVEIAVHHSDTPDAALDSTIKNAKATVVQEMLYGYADRHDWNGGLHSLNTVAKDSQGNVVDGQGNKVFDANGNVNPGAGAPASPYGDVLDAKEKDRLTQFLRNDQATVTNRIAAQQSIQERQAKVDHENTEQTKLAEYAANLASAAGDPNKKNTIFDHINQDVKTGAIGEQKARNLVNPTFMDKQRDDMYINDMTTKMQLGDISPEDAIRVARTDNYVHLSPEGYKELQKVAMNQTEFMAKNPGWLPSINSAKASTNEAFTSLTASMSPADKAEMTDKMNTAYGQFHNSLSKDPTMDTSRAMQVALKSAFGADVSDIPTGATAESVTKLRQETAAKNIALIKSGQLDPRSEAARKALSHDRELLYAQILLETEKKSQRYQQSIQQNSAAPAAR